MTAVLGLILALAGGILYGSQRWFPSSDQVTPATPAAPASGVTLRQAGASRKPDRPRTVDNMGFTTVRTSNTPDTSAADRTRKNRNVVDVAEDQAENKPVVVAKPQTVSGGQEPRSTTTRKSVRRPGAPSIRFPNPSFEISAGAFPDSRLRTYGSSSAAPSSAAPKFIPCGRCTEDCEVLRAQLGVIHATAPAR